MSFVLAAAGAMFACTPISVWDGDGPIRCQEGPRIRLEGIAAREMDGTCSRGHPCPRASAEAAREALVQLLGGPRGRLRTGHIQVRYPTMQCRSAGTSYERVVASCTLQDGRDLSAAMIRTGTVLPWPH
jgi:endonuclease YncB( thermonuclease family)